MTTPQTPVPGPPAHDPHRAPAGPDAGSARTARRAAGLGLTVLLLAAGGATAAYATGDQTADPAGYGVVTDGSSTPDRAADTPAGGKGTASDGSTSSERRDCPEKNDGSGGSGEQGTTPAPSPSTEAPAPAPDPSTL